MGKPTHVSEIKERLFREMPYQRVRIDGVENGIALVDNHGYAMELQEMKELVEGLSATIAHIERTGDNFLERENVEQRISEVLEGALYYGRGAFFYRKQFREDLKRHWSFVCDSCEENISSKDGGYYYETRFIPLSGRYCSKNCCINEFLTIPEVKNYERVIGDIKQIVKFEDLFDK